MRPKFLIPLFALLVLCLLGLLLFDLDPKADSAASIQDANRKNSFTSSKPKEREGKPPREAREKTEGEQKAKTFWEKKTYPERLKVADINMPIVFEGEVSDELKQVMLSDIHMIYGHMEGHEIYGLHKEILLKEMGVSLTKQISFKGKGRHWPEEHQEAFGRIAKLNQGDAIVLPKKLISSYKLAWEERNKDPQKYERFEAFIDWLNTASMEELKEDNPYWLYGHDGVSDENPELASEIRSQLLGDERSNLKFRHPSILEFTYVDQETLEKEDAEGKLPVGITLADGHYIDANDMPIQQALFLYDGNKWHISFAPPGT